MAEGEAAAVTVETAGAGDGASDANTCVEGEGEANGDRDALSADKGTSRVAAGIVAAKEAEAAEVATEAELAEDPGKEAAAKAEGAVVTEAEGAEPSAINRGNNTGREAAGCTSTVCGRGDAGEAATGA